VKSGKANMQPVRVDLTQGNIALIGTGVLVGDQVVVDGQERLQSGTPVEVHNAAQDPATNGGSNNVPPSSGESGDHADGAAKKKAEGKPN